MGRIAPLTGVGFVVLLIIGFAVAGDPPDADQKNAAKLVEHYVDNKDSIMLGSALVALAAASFVFFGGYIRQVLSETGGDKGFLPAIAMAGTILVAAGGAFDATLTFTMAETAEDVGDGAILALSALFENDFLPIAAGTFVFLLATGLSVVRGAGALPKWLGWLMVVLAITAITPIGFVAFLGMGVVVLITSVLLAVRAGGANPA